ncbi:hypothetical protein BDQ17DRAFT_1365798 [Cyathus striatus]|nr:hypothetical protein BDQ17DRAFT_1365798 [Cyathus striatus]
MSSAHDNIHSPSQLYTMKTGDGRQVDENIYDDLGDTYADSPHRPTPESGDASSRLLVPPAKTSTTISKLANGGEIVYRASVFEDCQYGVVNVKGDIHNSAGPGHLPFLYDLLCKGLITSDKLCDMYSALMHTDRMTVSEVSTVISKGGMGNEFITMGIYNGTANRRSPLQTTLWSCVLWVQLTCFIQWCSSHHQYFNYKTTYNE